MTYNVREDPVRDWGYHTVCENLSPNEVGRFICAIQESDQYELGQYCHIFLKGSDSAVGYIEEDKIEGNVVGRLDLVDRSNEDLHQHHSFLIDILYSCLN